MPALPIVSDLRDLINPDQDVDDAKPQDKALEKRIGDHGSQLGVEIQQVVVFPGRHPWETEQKHPELEREQDVKKVETLSKPIWK
jgi:hypothetical protein